MKDLGIWKSKKVLLFNRKHKLSHIISSLRETAKTLGVSNPTIHNACTGKTVCVGKEYYARFLDEEVISLEVSDLGNLTVSEYDDLCGVKRLVYAPVLRINKK